jgi:hypothetical protein
LGGAPWRDVARRLICFSGASATNPSLQLGKLAKHGLEIIRRAAILRDHFQSRTNFTQRDIAIAAGGAFELMGEMRKLGPIALGGTVVDGIPAGGKFGDEHFDELDEIEVC